MKARVKPDCVHNTVTACGGILFNRREWIDVPAHEQESAANNPALEIEPETETPAQPEKRGRVKK